MLPLCADKTSMNAQTKNRWKSKVSRARPGFTLITTLSLLVLLTLICVGMLGLAGISLRTGSAGNDQMTARAHARLALMIALGELQKTVGRDQAITAQASVLDTNPTTAAIDGIAEPLLTGVWNSRAERLGQRPDYSRTTPFRQWLVSHRDPTALNQLAFATAAHFTDPVVLLKSTTPNPANPRDGQVRAGRVPLPRGAYAWWVGDENVKARIGLRDPLDRATTTPVVGDLLTGMATPGTHGMRTVAGYEQFPTNSATSDNIITHRLTDFARAQGTAASDPFPHFSPYSRSVLADVTQGGLRKDLNCYLERTDLNWYEGWGRFGGSGGMPQGPRGPNNLIALSPPDDHDVLPWKQLHHWYHMHRQQLGSQQNFPVEAMFNGAPVEPINNPAWNSGVLRLTPILVRMQMLISFGTRRQGTSSSYQMVMHSYPVLTLWNPYNVPMQVGEWSTFLHTLPLEHSVFINGTRQTLTGGGTRNGNYNWGWPDGNMTLRVGGSTGPSITLAPGEAKLMTYSVSQSGNFNAHDMIEAPPAWLPTRAGQARSLGTISGSPSDRFAISTELATWEKSATSYAGQNFQTTFDFRCESRAIHNGHSWLQQGQMFTSQVGWRHEAANPRVAFISERNFPAATLAEIDNNPRPFLMLDIRLKTLDEPALPNKTWLHNIPHHPYVAVTSTSRHGVDARTPFFAHPYTITFEQVNGVEGLFQNRPFFGASNRPGGQSRIVGAAIPLAPLTSLGQLQNIPLLPIEGLNWSGYYFQNQAIGNSFASPGLPPDRTREPSFPFYLGQYMPWQGGDLAGRFYNDRAAFNNAEYSIAEAPAQIVDRSYAANHLLFDEYFFSSISARQGSVFNVHGPRRTQRQALADFFNGVRPLPITAYQPYLAAQTAPNQALNSLSTTSTVRPDAFQRIAARIMVDGGFNINSTSVEAWTAILASANLKRPVLMPGDSRLAAQQPRAHVISRNPNPATGNASEDSRWLGYRELTDAEIRQLAEAVVRQVKLRGPFRSLGEFVNRRLTTSTDLARYGALQAALEDPAVDINRRYRGAGMEITSADITGTNYRFPQAALGSRYQGTPAYVNQADILTTIAPLIQARSDTFVIRGYGEARTPDNTRITARAWCEAVVQRVPDFIDPRDEAHVTTAAMRQPLNRRFGRKFLIQSFRWVPSTEVENS